MKKRLEDFKDFMFWYILLNPMVPFAVSLAALIISIVKLVLRQAP